MIDAAAYDDLARRWLETQQQAWQAWLGGVAMAPPPIDPAAALAGGFDPATPGGEVAERLLGQGRQFLQLAEALGESLATAARDGTPPDWPTRVRWAHRWASGFSGSPAQAMRRRRERS